MNGWMNGWMVHDFLWLGKVLKDHLRVCLFLVLDKRWQYCWCIGLWSMSIYDKHQYCTDKHQNHCKKTTCLEEHCILMPSLIVQSRSTGSIFHLQYRLLDEISCCSNGQGQLRIMTLTPWASWSLPNTLRRYTLPLWTCLHRELLRTRKGGKENHEGYQDSTREQLLVAVLTVRKRYFGSSYPSCQNLFFDVFCSIPYNTFRKDHTLASCFRQVDWASSFWAQDSSTANPSQSPLQLEDPACFVPERELLKPQCKPSRTRGRLVDGRAPTHNWRKMLGQVAGDTKPGSPEGIFPTILICNFCST